MPEPFAKTLPPLDPTIAQTEAVNPDTCDIDTLDTRAVLEKMNAADQHVATAIAAALPQIVPLVDCIQASLQLGGRLFYIGAGTSGRLGVLDAAECPPTFSTDPDLVQGIIAGGDKALKHAVEGAEDSASDGEAAIVAHGIGPHDVVIGLSASGAAAYVQAALVKSHQHGAKTGCITCSGNSPLLSLCNFPILVETGPEVITGSTRLKAGTAQKLVLNMISTSVMIGMGKTFGNLMVDVKPTNKKLRARAIRLVCWLADCDEETAIDALEATQWQVKPAILVQRYGWSLETACNKLSQHNGKLKAIINKAST